jgi:hypothetical protein
MENNVQTVLEKCGITARIIQCLKIKGLVVPEQIKPVEKPLRSPSEEWFYSIADRFTPPLSQAEKEVYMKSPHLLCLKILDSVNLLFEVSNILYDALEAVKQKLKGEEAVAAILAILKVFHGCLDHNYLKYDRHLEYHEYEESPVGYYWKKLQKLCKKASQKANIKDKNRWVNEKILQLISGPRRILVTSEYAICCKHVYADLKRKIPNLENLSINSILKKIKTDFPDFFEVIKVYSESFYRSLTEFLRDSIMAKHIDPLKEIVKSKEVSSEAIREVKNNLSEKDAQEFERTLEIIEDFLAIQEFEGLIAYGIKKNRENRLFDVLIKAYDVLQAILTLNIEFVKPKYKEFVRSLLTAEDVPSKYVAVRRLISEGEYCFDENVERLYLDELRRWK